MICGVDRSWRWGVNGGRRSNLSDCRVSLSSLFSFLVHYDAPCFASILITMLNC